MICPFCQKEMELVDDEFVQDQLSRESIFSCHACRIGIQTSRSVFKLEDDE